MKVISCANNRFLISISLILSMFFLSFYNLALSFSLNSVQVTFLTLKILSVIFSLYILVNVLEKNLLYNASSSLFSIITSIFAFYFILNNNYLINIFTSLLNESSFSNLLLLFIGFLINLTYQIFTLLFCISIIVFIPHGLISYILNVDYKMERTYIFLKEISLIFIVAILLKNIINIFLQRVLM